MVFHLSVIDGKSPQVSRTFLSILVDLSNAVVLMVSTRPPISISSTPITKPMGTVQSAPIITDITVTFLFHYFLVHLQEPSVFSLFVLFFLIFILWSARTAKSTIRQVLFFIFYFLLIINFDNYPQIPRPGLGDRKIPENFVCPILHDRFCFVHIPLSAMVKLQFLLAQFPINHLSHPVMFSLIFPLCG